MSFIDTLKNQNIPTDSYLVAINYLQEQGDLTEEEYRIRIIELTGLGDNCEGFALTKYSYLYIVQESIRASTNSTQVNMAEMYTLGVQKAIAFLDKNNHLTDDYQASEDLNNTGKPKPKRGSKKALTCQLWSDLKDTGLSRQEWIALLVKEVDLTPSGASTYYAKLKKGEFGC